MARSFYRDDLSKNELSHSVNPIIWKCCQSSPSFETSLFASVLLFAVAVQDQGNGIGDVGDHGGERKGSWWRSGFVLKNRLVTDEGAFNGGGSWR